MIAKTILIVDDDAGMRDNLKDILKDEGYAPLSAGSCSEALVLAKREDVQAAILDLKLPDGSGTELLAALKQLNPNCLCTILTAYADLDSAMAAVEQGAFHYLQKPVRPVELLGILERVFETIRLRNAKHEAEEALRQSEEKHRTILESINEGYFEMDLSGAFTFCNRAVCDLLGYSRDEFLGMDYQDISAPETSKRLFQIFNEVYRTGKPSSLIEFEAVRKDGSKAVHELAGYPMEDSSGRPAGLRGLVRDVTETRKLQSQVQHMQRIESMGTIASGVAHNFRNILAGISMNTQLLELDYPDNPSLVDISKRVREAVGRGARLVDGLMQFSRKPETKEFEVLDLTKVIQETHDLVSRTFDQKITIRIDLPDPISVKGDHSGLSQVFMNLCTNARDAMPSGGELRIEAKQEEDDAVVSVSDTGHGMDKATCERCFDPFYTTKGIGKGTGLGLSTSYGIVRDHGGDIHVHSEVGQGTTFHVYLPIAPGHKGRIEEKSDRVIHGKGEKVLIVDDEADIREPIEYMLTRLGYRVHSAGSGSEAIDSYWSWQPDVVLLDRNMPGMDGLTCAHKILEADPEAKILFVSGYGQNDPDGVNGHMSKLIKGYLTKPINIQELSQALNRLFSE